MELCRKCRKNPRTHYDSLCRACLSKKSRDKYATDETFRKLKIKLNIESARKRKLKDPLWAQKKAAFDNQWRLENKERFTYLQARSAFNRLSPDYKKKLMSELNE